MDLQSLENRLKAAGYVGLNPIDLSRKTVDEHLKTKGVGRATVRMLTLYMAANGYGVIDGRFVKTCYGSGFLGELIIDRIVMEFSPTVQQRLEDIERDAVDRIDLDKVAGLVYRRVAAKIDADVKVAIDDSVAAVKEANATIIRGNKLMDSTSAGLREAMAELEVAKGELKRAMKKIEEIEQARKDELADLKLSLFDMVVGKKGSKPYNRGHI